MIKTQEKEKRGFFIVLEGNDGSGKSTQVKLLVSYLRGVGKDVFVTREQSASKYGKKISELVVSEEGEKLSYEEWLKLYTLDRIEHLKKEVLPALRQGKIVVCSRYDYSTCVYQLKDESKWKSYIIKFPRPDLTFIIIVPTKIALGRLHKRDRKITVFEKEKLVEERRKRYLRILSIGDNIKRIDGSKEVQGVFSEIKKELDDFLRLK